MTWPAVLAIFFLFWFFSLFLVLPFGIRTPDRDKDTLVPGQADGAPVNFRPWTVVLRTTVVASLLCGAYVLNYNYRWITAEDINPFPSPEEVTRQ